MVKLAVGLRLAARARRVAALQVAAGFWDISHDLCADTRSECHRLRIFPRLAHAFPPFLPYFLVFLELVILLLG